jgi:hypothetical protein
MNDFLEKLKVGLTEAQERQKEIGARLQAINAEYQAVSQEVNSYLKIVEVENRKLQGSPNPHKATATFTIKVNPAPTAQIAAADAVDEPNKTELVRELLRSHPSGMTGGELWTAVKGKFPHRQYVYSVLKRLKKKGDVVQRRKKFIFTFKPEEVNQTTVQ